MRDAGPSPITSALIIDRVASWMGLAACMAVFLAIGAWMSVITRASLATGWYDALEKSPLNPPDIAFGIVWTFLYVGLAIVLWLLWKERNHIRGRIALLFFGVQQFLNWGWTPVFFLYMDPAAGACWLAALVVLAGLATVKIKPVSTPAFVIMIPYMAWLLFALYLNVEIWRLNSF